MRNPLSIMLAASIVFLIAAGGYADTSGVVNVTVTIQQSISVEITGGPIDFGSMGVGEAAVSLGSISVLNNGSGIDETITVSFTDPAGWTHGVPGENIYRLSFQFSASQPPADDANWRDAGLVSEEIAYNAAKTLWIKLETPTATGITSQQTIPVTITAEAE